MEDIKISNYLCSGVVCGSHFLWNFIGHYLNSQDITESLSNIQRAHREYEEPKKLAFFFIKQTILQCLLSDMDNE